MELATTHAYTQRDPTGQLAVKYAFYTGFYRHRRYIQKTRREEKLNLFIKYGSISDRCCVTNSVPADIVLISATFPGMKRKNEILAHI